MFGLDYGSCSDDEESNPTGDVGIYVDRPQTTTSQKRGREEIPSKKPEQPNSGKWLKLDATLADHLPKPKNEPCVPLVDPTNLGSPPKTIETETLQLSEMFEEKEPEPEILPKKPNLAPLTELPPVVGPERPPGFGIPVPEIIEDIYPDHLSDVEMVQPDPYRKQYSTSPHNIIQKPQPGSFSHVKKGWGEWKSVETSNVIEINGRDLQETHRLSKTETEQKKLMEQAEISVNKKSSKRGQLYAIALEAEQLTLVEEAKRSEQKAVRRETKAKYGW